jgi:cytochrome c biogenesis protein CcmG/thiol:disulfide interchange protein DsbE
MIVMGRSWLAVSVLVVLTTILSGCAGTSVDVTNSAGDPESGSTVSGPVGSATVQKDAPRCPKRYAATGEAGLACLGPGPKIDVFDLPGVVVVPVWASWCGPCREELPTLQSFYESGANVVGVAAADNSSAAASMTEELSLTFPSVQDPDSETRATLGWSGLPATFLLRDGVVVGRITGQVTSEEQLRQAVGEAQGE